MTFFKRYFKHLLFAAALFLAAAAIFFNPLRLYDADIGSNRTAFFQKYGWVTESEPYLCEQVQIPLEFDHTLDKYNEIQKRSGFDLSKYRGAVAKRYSYRVLNHLSDKRYAYANIFVYQKKIIAADIVSPKINGFIAAVSDVQFQERK